MDLYALFSFAFITVYFTLTFFKLLKASFPMIGAVLGALLVNKPMQFYGRKSALIGHYLIFITGFLITGFTYFAKHKALLYVGRFLMGFAAGCTTPASQIYVIFKEII